jgi:hypothetical protein
MEEYIGNYDFVTAAVSHISHFHLKKMHLLNSILRATRSEDVKRPVRKTADGIRREDGQNCTVTEWTQVQEDSQWKA